MKDVTNAESTTIMTADHALAIACSFITRNGGFGVRNKINRNLIADAVKTVEEETTLTHKTLEVISKEDNKSAIEFINSRGVIINSNGLFDADRLFSNYETAVFEERLFANSKAAVCVEKHSSACRMESLLLQLIDGIKKYAGEIYTDDGKAEHVLKIIDSAQSVGRSSAQKVADMMISPYNRGVFDGVQNIVGKVVPIRNAYCKGKFVYTPAPTYVCRNRGVLIPTSIDSTNAMSVDGIEDIEFQSLDDVEYVVEAPGNYPREVFRAGYAFAEYVERVNSIIIDYLDAHTEGNEYDGNDADSYRLHERIIDLQEKIRFEDDYRVDEESSLTEGDISMAIRWAQATADNYKAEIEQYLARMIAAVEPAKAAVMFDDTTEETLNEYEKAIIDIYFMAFRHRVFDARNVYAQILAANIIAAEEYAIELRDRLLALDSVEVNAESERVYKIAVDTAFCICKDGWNFHGYPLSNYISQRYCDLVIHTDEPTGTEPTSDAPDTNDAAESNDTVDANEPVDMPHVDFYAAPVVKLDPEPAMKMFTPPTPPTVLMLPAPADEPSTKDIADNGDSKPESDIDDLIISALDTLDNTEKIILCMDRLIVYTVNIQVTQAANGKLKFYHCDPRGYNSFRNVAIPQETAFNLVKQGRARFVDYKPVSRWDGAFELVILVDKDSNVKVCSAEDSLQYGNRASFRHGFYKKHAKLILDNGGKWFEGKLGWNGIAYTNDGTVVQTPARIAYSQIGIDIDGLDEDYIEQIKSKFYASFHALQKLDVLLHQQSASTVDIDATIIEPTVDNTNDSVAESDGGIVADNSGGTLNGSFAEIFYSWHQTSIDANLRALEARYETYDPITKRKRAERGFAMKKATMIGRRQGYKAPEHAAVNRLDVDIDERISVAKHTISERLADIKVAFSITEHIVVTDKLAVIYPPRASRLAQIDEPDNVVYIEVKKRSDGGLEYFLLDDEHIDGLPIKPSAIKAKKRRGDKIVYLGAA